MEKLRICIFLENSFNMNEGGGYSYYERLIQQIDNFNFDSKLEIVFANCSEEYKGEKKTIPIYLYKIRKKKWNLLNRIIKKISNIFSQELSKKFSIIIEKKISYIIEKDLKKYKIDLIYNLKPNINNLNYPFIATHWDLGHKTSYAFPEVSMNGDYEWRDEYHQITLNKAFAIIAESKKGKNELVDLLKINPNRIFVLPMFPGRVVELNINHEIQLGYLKKRNLIKNKFIFYPAQFWSHKNHYTLLLAFKNILLKNPDFKLVLCGSDKGNLNYIKEVIEHNNLNNSVILTGFINDDELYSLYVNATAMVMLSFIGPTNMPLLESAVLGCPLICSNLSGHIEQMGTYPIYVDPTSEVEVANAIQNVIDNKTKNNFEYTNIESCEILNDIFLKIYPIRKTFGYDYLQIR